MGGSVSELQQAVALAYANELNRQPDADGSAAYTNLLLAGVPLGQVQLSIAQSTEAQADINGLYLDTLGRAVDPTGLAASTQALAAGASLAQLRANLVNSPEGQGAIGGVYKAVLDRPADAGGLLLYTRAVTAGASLGQVRADLASSPEAASVVARAFQFYLERAPSSQEVGFYTAALGSGASYGAIRAGLISSPEDAQAIQGLYRQYLGRAASADEVQGIRRMLYGGGTLDAQRPTLDAQGRLQASTVPDQTAALTAAYEDTFGHTPADAPNENASTIPTLQDELALGRPFAEVRQVTDFRQPVPGGFSDTYGYAVPARYSDDGYSLFLGQESSTSHPSARDAAGAVPLAVTGPGATGPDTISLTLAQVLTAPLTFGASLDGRPLGQATLPAASSFGVTSAGIVSFSGDFAAGRELDLTFGAIPLDGLHVVSGTLNGRSFLLAGAANGTGTAIALFPHASNAGIVRTDTFPFS
jgi:hypothetical protein